MTINRSENEFEPKANGFQKIIDESYEDTERRYLELLRNECM